MSSMSDHLSDSLVKAVFMGVAYTMPTERYVALFTVMPQPDGTGGTEVSGGSYARKLATFEDGNEAGEVVTSADLVWTNMPDCTIVGAGVYSAVTGGNLLTLATLPSARIIAVSETLTAAAGTVSIKFQ